MKKLLIILCITALFGFGCDAGNGSGATGGCQGGSSSGSSSGGVTQADNPLIKGDFRSADPSPLVHDGKFYIVTGEDGVNNRYITGTRAFNMPRWHLLSSADMINWDKETITFKKIIKDSRGNDKIIIGSDYDCWPDWMEINRAWASCIVYRNGYFYFYACNETKISVLRSSKIAGPYEDILGHALIDQSTDEPYSGNMRKAKDIDPMCFIDDKDGQAYLIWGGDGVCRYAKLGTDMKSLMTPPGVMDVPGLTDPIKGYYYLEAPFIIKENGTYFLMYATGPWPSEIHYATTNKIDDNNTKWTYRGRIGTRTGTGTNHEGAAYFKGQWWYTYHSEELSQGNQYAPFSRSVCVDKMYINGNTIEPINYTSLTLY